MCCSDPEQVSVGNPINPGIGNKFQREQDYAANGPFPLHFVRTYNSGGPNIADPNVGFTPDLGAKWSHWRHSFERSIQVVASTQITTVRAFRHTGRVLAWNLFEGQYLPEADTTDVLQPLLDSVGVQTGWSYRSADDEVELYDISGRLLSIRNRAGLEQTLIYSDAATPTAIAPWGGLLIAVTDSFGNRIQLSYTSIGRLSTLLDPEGGIYQFAYGANGLLSSVTYPGGKARNYHYENATIRGGLTGITDENNERFATWTYDSQGRAASSAHGAGADQVQITYVTGASFITDANSVQRSFSTSNVLGLAKNTSISGPPCPSCGPQTRTYDANGNVSSRTDWNGNRSDYTYDLIRNLETSRTEGLTSAGGTTPQTRTISTQWHADFRLPTQIAEPLRITTNVYDTDGTACGARGALCSRTVQATTDANGAQGFAATLAGTPRAWTYTYNANGSVLTINGPRTDVSDITTYTYYANDDVDPAKRGKVATITNAAGHVTSIAAYNPHGQPLTIVDANFLTTTLTYDERQRLKTRSVGGELTTYDYDGVGQVGKVTLPDGSFLSYSYDAAHRLTGIQDNGGNRIAYTLDAMGNRTLEQAFDPVNTLAQTRSRVYSNLNRLFQELGALNQTTEYAYDDQGNVISVKDPLLHITTNQYDALNRPKQVTAPPPSPADPTPVTQYAYNGLDALTQVTDPRNLVTGYTIDGLGNLTLQASPDTGNTVNTYDAAGNLLTKTDAKGQLTTYVYDALNRVTLITFHDGSKQAYAYDFGTNGIGRLSSITETDASNQQTNLIQYAYTPQGRVSSETRTVGGVQYVLGYSYDTAGRLSGLTYPSGRTLTYSFDVLGRVSGINTTFNGLTQAVVSGVAYQPFGGVKNYTLGNGQVYTRGYDQDGRINTYSLGAKSFSIGYDAASRIEFINEFGNPSNTNSYGYDGVDRLTSAVTPGTPYSYTYDAVGNRRSKTVGAATDTLVYSAASNRIATLTPATGPARSFIFDANGSTTNDGVNTYAYDVRGRMVQATSVIGATNYQLNALGQRIRKTNSQGDTVFHYDTWGHLIAETGPAGALKREFIYLGDIPVGVVQ
jgi:YD repeat-containing protein